MITEFVARGNVVYWRGYMPDSDWEELNKLGTADTPEIAAKAAQMITRAHKLNSDRKYTASARMYERVAQLEGYKEEKPCTT